MASAVICLSTGRKFNFSKYIFDSLVRNVDSNSKFYMYPRVGKGFSGVETPLFEGMIVVQENVVEGIADEQVQDDVTVTTAPEDVNAAVEEDIQAQIIPSLPPPTSPSPPQDIPSTSYEAVEVVTTAKLITEAVAAASTPVSAASTIIPAAEPNIPAATITAAPIKVAAAFTRRRRGVVIRDPEEESSDKTSDETNSKDKGKGIMVEYLKPMKKKQQVEMDEAYARKLHEEFNQDIDRDVAIEHATPLARKVTIVDYQIIHLNNKPRYKIIRVDETHQLYVSFITLLKNFDREDLESLWSIVKERLSTSNPNNFFDEYLLTTLRAMFGKPDGQDNVWKSQRSVHG
nr:hypothetical protein [Tanacetum cinerariifolium]